MSSVSLIPSACKVRKPKSPFDFRHKPPYPARKHRPPRRKQVTIAAGFHYKDGVVICADSEMTHPQALKIGEEKIQFFPGRQACMVMTGAGDRDFIRMAFEKVVRKLQASPANIDNDDVQAAIEDTVVELYERHIAALPPAINFDGFSLLAAVSSSGPSIRLIKTTDTAVSSSLSFESIGTGAILGKYLADTMYEPDMPQNQAVTLASYIVYVAKNYISGCGGKTSIVTFDAKEIQNDWDREVYALENYFDSFSREIRPLFLTCPDEQASDQDFENKLAKFAESLRRMRKDKKNF